MRHTVAIVVLLGVCAFGAAALDQKRQGFILGAGVGGGLVSFTQTVEFLGFSSTSPRESDLAFRSDFRIGAGLSERFLLYWSSRVSWFGMQNALGDEVIVTNGIGGLGLSYYFKREAVSPYLTASAGYSTWGLPFEPEASDWFGLGGTVGMGYEFAQGWSFEVVANAGNPSETERGLTATTNALGVSVTINGLAY